ncbi:transposase [Gluconobacter wancherniae]|nr:transposase [Gluconobacter wancherniae]
MADGQMEHLRPFFPKSHSKPRADDRRVLSRIIFVNRNGIPWRDSPREYGPHKTLYDRWTRLGGMSIFSCE